MSEIRKFRIIVNSKECGTCSGSSPSSVSKKVVKKLDLTRDVKNNVCRAYDQTIDHHSKGLYSRKGTFEDNKGKNTLGIINKVVEENNIEIHSLSSLISNGLNIDEFLRIDPFKQFELLLDENLNSDEDIELMLFFLELSDKYQTDNFIDIESLLSPLLIEFHLNMNDELIDTNEDLEYNFEELDGTWIKEFEAKNKKK